MSLAEPGSVRGLQDLPSGRRGDELRRLPALAAGALERVIQSPAGSLWLLAGMMSLSLIARAVSAAAKPFWFDELFTVILARLPSMDKVREVLDTGADAMPLFYYWLEKQAGRLPLDPHIAFRLPSVVGYALAVVGVYFFVRRSWNAPAGLAAAMVLALSPFREYAIEARPYALMVGFIAVAAALWQRVEAGLIYPALLAGALGLGVASHHYTVVALIAFGLAEATWLVLRHRWRWRVWVPLGVSTIPFWLGLPLLLRFREVAGPNYWAKPNWTGITSTYPLSGLPLAYFVPFCLAGVLGLTQWGWRALATRSQRTETEAELLAQLSLTGALLLFPVILLFVTLATGGGYTLRYNWPFITGFAIACGAVVAIYIRRRAAALLAAALVFSLFAREAFEILTMPHRDPKAEQVKMLQGLTAAERELEPGLPIANCDMLYSIPLYYYGDPATTRRLVTLVDVESSLRYIGNDTVAHAVLGLNRVVPLSIRETKLFLAENQRFYIWSPPIQSRWLLHYLRDRGYQLQVAAAAGQEDLVFLAEAYRGRPAGGVGGAANSSERARHKK